MRTLGPFALTLLVAGAPTARAADETAMPPRFRADVAVGYRGAFEQAGLEEAGTAYAIRNTLRHDIVVDAIVAVWDGVGLTLGLPATASQTVSWPGARAMRIDPLTGEGTYAGGAAISPPDWQTSGLQGVWIGVAGSPLREGWRRSLPVTARFDFAVRTPAAGQTPWGDARGASPGGGAVRLGAAFSSQVRRTDTWLSFRYTRELATEVDVVLPDGAPHAAPVRVREGDTIVARIGGDVVLKDDRARGVRTAFGVWGGVGWTGEARRPSGFWLPDVLDASRGTQVVAGDRLQADLGLRLAIDPARQAGVRVGLVGSYLSPRAEEHLYPVATDNRSFAIGWDLTVIGRVRLRDEPAIDGAPAAWSPP